MEHATLTNYLSYYLNLETPGYAVLITGEWGSGKTYQILKTIPQEIQCHVSLFGISSSQEIYSTVFSKMFPGKHLAKKIIGMTKDITSELNGVTFGAGALVGSILDPMIKQTVDKSKIIIFDDLERCPMANKEILGVINQYVEHHQCRVVVIAHDDKTQDDFIDSKEKIIGHTIKIEPQIDAAAVSFFSSHYKLNNYYSLKPSIIETFKKTKCQSLRVLKYTINDCARLLDCLEHQHIKNSAAMQVLYTTFCLFSIEHRMGNITTDDIKNTVEDYYDYAIRIGQEPVNDEELTPHQARRLLFFKKYNELELINPLLDYELLSSIIETGDYPKDKITSSLSSSKYFVQQKKNPPWKILYNFEHIVDEAVTSAINEMSEQFKSLQITEIGELLHSFCISFYLSEKKETLIDFETLKNLQIDYIDRLFDNELLKPKSIIYDPFEDDIYSNSHGHRYWITSSYESFINEIIQHLDSKREQSRLRNYGKYADEILLALETDIDKFKQLMIEGNKGNGTYAQIDVLKTISPTEFLIHWLMQPVEYWDKVRMILNTRYRGAKFNMLKNEEQWLKELIVAISLEAQLYHGLKRNRIERLIPYSALKSF